MTMGVQRALFAAFGDQLKEVVQVCIAHSSSTPEKHLRKNCEITPATCENSLQEGLLQIGWGSGKDFLGGAIAVGSFK
jgi:hypothetical protein